MLLESSRHSVRRETARSDVPYRTEDTRPLTPRELQLASDLELARGNRQRGELLSWQAHDARAAVSA